MPNKGELFKIKSVKIETLAQYLSQIRNQMNLDIKTVSMLTQIKPQFLESLENGNYDQLPAEVYVRGFLKKLANYYHIKEELLIEQYEKEKDINKKQPSPIVAHIERFNLNPRIVIISVTLILAVVAIGYVASQIRSVLAPPLLEVFEPPSDTFIAGNTLVVSGQAEVGSDVTINGQVVLLDRNGQFSENLVVGNGLNVVEIIAKNKFNKESKLTRRVNAEIPSTATIQTQPVVVTVEIGPDSAWVYLEADGVVQHRGTMLPQSSKTVTANNEVLLTTANAGSTKVIYNGQDLGNLGREGEVIRNIEFSSLTIQ